ncbi:conjugal transfer protein TrbC [Sphingomonas sp. ABOLF]|uniref:TrbC/VirB2 family protein n=1 Tax=Sphingomonas sp. ABOLF TaxID=1985879 RepID=UPI000F7DD8F8|nr:TrbC/VirB2 family protein [Sphingomonas sp. ABOLF]RSV12393.1 conjugal transfer protein TrbC [Sphingomonas sp. ABOLF]
MSVRKYVHKVRQTRRMASGAVFLAVMSALSSPAYAGSSGGGGLPWESPLQTITQSITGPVAFAVSVIGVVAAGAGLIWGGEISGFTRTLIFVVLVIGLIVAATNILSTLFGVGAMV